MQLFHATARSNWTSIQEKGLIPAVQKRGMHAESFEPAVYLFEDVETANDALAGWLGEYIRDTHAIILAVDVPDDQLQEDPELAGSFYTLAPVRPESLKFHAEVELGCEDLPFLGDEATGLETPEFQEEIAEDAPALARLIAESVPVSRDEFNASCEFEEEGDNWQFGRNGGVVWALDPETNRRLFFGGKSYAPPPCPSVPMVGSQEKTTAMSNDHPVSLGL